MKRAGYKVGDRVIYNVEPGWFRCRIIDVRPREYLLVLIVEVNGCVRSVCGAYVWPHAHREITLSRRRPIDVGRLRPEPPMSLEDAQRVLTLEGAVELVPFEMMYVARRPSLKQPGKSAIAAINWDFDTKLWRITDWTEG